VAIRGHIPELDGKSDSDVFPLFQDKLGEPLEIDKLEDVIEWFEYDDSDQKLVPVYSSNEEKWGLQCIFESRDCELDFCIPGNYANHVLEDMQKIFPTIKNVVIHIYSWYTGVDEPVTFKSTNV